MSAVPDRSEIGPYPGGSRAISGVVPWTWPSQARFRDRAISPKAPRPRCRTARRSVPTREVLGRYPGLYRGLGLPRHASGVGRFLRKRRVHSAGPLGDRSLPGRFSGNIRDCTVDLAFPGTLPELGDFSESAMSAVPDRSEIGPYRGGSRAISGTRPWAWPSQARFRGRAISPKAPCPQSQIARRSVPTREVLRQYPGLYRGLGLPRHASEVGRFLRKRHVHRAGPLGDRSLPGRFSGDIRDSAVGLAFPDTLPELGDFSESATSAVPDRSEIGPYRGGSRAISGIVPWTWHSQARFRGRAISPKAPCPRCRTARRSVPTGEVLRRYPGLYRGLGLPRHASEVGRFF
jgi:hypothetical protein